MLLKFFISVLQEKQVKTVYKNDTITYLINNNKICILLVHAYFVCMVNSYLNYFFNRFGQWMNNGSWNINSTVINGGNWYSHIQTEIEWYSYAWLLIKGHAHKVITCAWRHCTQRITKTGRNLKFETWQLKTYLY